MSHDPFERTCAYLEIVQAHEDVIAMTRLRMDALKERVLSIEYELELLKHESKEKRHSAASVSKLRSKPDAKSAVDQGSMI